MGRAGLPSRSGTQTESGSAHGGQGRAHDCSSARRPAPCRALGTPPELCEASGLGSELRAEARVPARLGVPPPSPGRRSRGSHCPRRAKRVKGPLPAPQPPPRRQAQGARTRTNSGFRATGAAGPTPSHFLRNRTRRGPEALLGKGAPRSPSSKPSPGSRQPATSTHSRGSEPLTCCRDLGLARPRGRNVSPGPGAQRRRARRRRQVQPRPAARAGGRTQESRFAPKSGAYDCPALRRQETSELQPPTLGAEGKPAQPVQRILDLGDLSEFTLSPGAPLLLPPLLPSSSSRKPALTPA